MAMPAGKRDRRIRIERATATANSLNEPIQTWADLGDGAGFWAEKHDVSDRERVASAEVSAEITTRFRIRWSEAVRDVNPKDRVVYDGRTYEIAAVKEIGRHEGLEISAAARSDL